jgi:hypothetical protein
MTTLNVPLSDSLRGFVEDEATRQGSTAAEYVARLIADQQARRSIQRQLDEGLDDPRRIEADEAYWQQKRESIRHRLNRRDS